MSERRPRRGVYGRIRGRENGHGLQDFLRTGKSVAGHLAGRGDRAAGEYSCRGQIPAGNTKRENNADGRIFSERAGKYRGGENRA